MLHVPFREYFQKIAEKETHCAIVMNDPGLWGSTPTPETERVRLSVLAGATLHSGDPGRKPGLS